MINRTKAKRWLIGLGVTAVIAVVVLNILAYRHAYAMMHFVSAGERTAKPEKLGPGTKIKVLLSGVTLPRPQTTTQPASFHSDCRTLTIESADGIKLGAWHCPSVDSKAVIILFHGYGGEKTGTIREAKAFLELGLSVLLVDFRGSGESSESYTSVGYDEAEDVAAVVRHAREQLGYKKIVLYGQSMGAAAIFRAVDSCGVDPDGIISEAVFDTLLNTVRHRFDAMGVPSFPSAELLVFWGGRQAGFDGFTHNPADYARKVSCPILFLHGSADPRAQLADARRVFDAVPGKKQFREFKVGHEPALVRFPGEWKNTVSEWLNQSVLER